MNEFLEDNLSTLKKLPHSVKLNKYVQVTSNVIWEKIHSIIEACAALYEGPSVSLSSDFYRDKHRREDYGALMCNLVVQQYCLRLGHHLVFISPNTVQQLKESQIGLFHNVSAITNDLKPVCSAVGSFLLDFVKFELS